MTRTSRAPDDMRPVHFTRGYTRHAEGSVLVEFGETRILCTASAENRVPLFLRGNGQGWITAEYGMLPRATDSRTSREATRGRQSGRTLEIQRLIGRSLRAVVDLPALGERTITLDCDVLQADGSTRTAAITGAWVALADALDFLVHSGDLATTPMTGQVASVSVGLVDGEALLDLDYAEDNRADADVNIVMDQKGRFIEIQGTAEGGVFSDTQLLAMIALAKKGIRGLTYLQRQTRETLGT